MSSILHQEPHPEWLCPHCKNPQTIGRSVRDGLVAEGGNVYCFRCSEISPLSGWDECKTAEEQTEANEKKREYQEPLP